VDVSPRQLLPSTLRQADDRDQGADWISTAFTQASAPGAKPRIALVLRRQDHNVLRFGQSCMETPLRIGSRTYAHELGFNTHWLDAAWFPGGFPDGVGNWSAKPKEFPNGLKPVSDECHRLGMRFVLWFEPERVAAGTALAREHPEFVLGGEKRGLFKLNDPTARRYLTDLLSQRISEYGIDVYRNDFNIDPLGFWRGNDAADRQGMTEIRRWRDGRTIIPVRYLAYDQVNFPWVKTRWIWPGSPGEPARPLERVQPSSDPHAQLTADNPNRP